MKNILPILQENGLSVKDAAKALEIKPATLEAKLENEHLMRLDEACRLADMLDCTIDGLFFDRLYSPRDVQKGRIIRKIEEMDNTQLDLVWFFVKGLTDKKEATADDPDPTR